jgi:hypothetical protein
VPRISYFHGIAIRMFFDEARHEGRPHFHAEYQDEVLSISLDGLEPLAGRIPPASKRLVLRWARRHEDDLIDNWARLRARKQPLPIPPLP